MQGAGPPTGSPPSVVAEEGAPPAKRAKPDDQPPKQQEEAACQNEEEEEEKEKDEHPLTFLESRFPRAEGWAFLMAVDPTLQDIDEWRFSAVRLSKESGIVPLEKRSITTDVRRVFSNATELMYMTSHEKRLRVVRQGDKEDERESLQELQEELFPPEKKASARAFDSDEAIVPGAQCYDD